MYTYVMFLKDSDDSAGNTIKKLSNIFKTEGLEMSDHYRFNCDDNIIILYDDKLRSVFFMIKKISKNIPEFDFIENKSQLIKENEVVVAHLLNYKAKQNYSGYALLKKKFDHYFCSCSDEEKEEVDDEIIIKKHINELIHKYKYNATNDVAELTLQDFKLKMTFKDLMKISIEILFIE